jgi:hypothetical protein
MAVTFDHVHAKQIVGALTTVDRLLVRGHLLSFRYRGCGLAGFLDRQGLNIVREFGGYVRQASDRVIAHALWHSRPGWTAVHLPAACGAR